MYLGGKKVFDNPHILDAIKTLNKKQPETYGTEELSDTSMESWTNETTPSVWTAFAMPDGTGTGTLVREASLVHSGTYACTMTTDGDGKGYGLAQKITGLISGDDYNCSAYFASSNIGDNAGAIFLNGILNVDATKMWDKIAQEWVDIGEIGEDNIYKIESLTGTFFEFEETIPAPENGVLGIHIVALGPTQTVTVDDVSIKRIFYPEAVNLFEIENDSDWDNMEGDKDNFVKWKIYNNNDLINLFVWDSADNKNSLKSDFLSAPILNKFNTPFIVGSVEVDLKTVQATKIFNGIKSLDGETNYFVIPTSIIVETKDANGLNGDATISIGNNSSSYNNIIDSSKFSYSKENKFINIDLSAEHVIGSPASDTYVNVTQADTGTSGTIIIKYFGYLESE